MHDNTNTHGPIVHSISFCQREQTYHPSNRENGANIPIKVVQYFQNVHFVTGLPSGDGIGLKMGEGSYELMLNISMQSATTFALGGKLVLEHPEVKVEVVRNSKIRVLQTWIKGFDHTLKTFTFSGTDELRKYTALKFETPEGLTYWTDLELFRELVLNVLSIQKPKKKSATFERVRSFFHSLQSPRLRLMEAL